MRIGEKVKDMIKSWLDIYPPQAQGITIQERLDFTANVVKLSIDDISNIVTVSSARFKTLYDFTNGCNPASGAKRIDYILIDPEAQVSRVKYSYIHLFHPGSDSRTSDNYLYQNRRYNGTFAIDHLFKDGCIIHAESEG